MKNIIRLIEIEKELREVEQALSLGFGLSSGIRDDLWLQMMERNGFIKSGRFIPIMDMIRISREMSHIDSQLFVILTAVSDGLYEISVEVGDL